VSDLPEVKNAPSASVALHELWRRRTEWMDDVDAVHAFVKRAISAGEFLTAYDAARATLDNHPDDDFLQQRMALALAQMGSSARAQGILNALVDKDPQNRETLSILGRTYKDQWCVNPENEEPLREAFACYSRAFEVEPPDSYPGINAATIALLLKDTDEAARLAKIVLNICEQQPDDYWKHATVAEALVVLGDVEAAKSAYRAAVAAEEKDNLRAFSSTRKQARSLSRQLYGRPDVFDECFPIPKLVVFSGHMIDAPDRRVPRFPLEKEGEIKTLLERQLAAMNAGIGFSSAASGSDILFLEAMLSRGGVIHLVLPWPAEEFVKTSVAIAGDGGWVERFHKVLDQAASIRVLGQLYMPGSATGFEYCNLAMNGLARIFARSLDLDITPLAVWDGYSGAPGGTGSFVRYWRNRGTPVKVVPIATKPPSMLHDTETFDVDASNSDDEFEAWVRASGRQEIKAIMFADVVGYSKLPETVIPKYVAQFNQRVSRLIADSSAAPVNVNTWGDGLFFVFNGVEDAGRFALDLRQLVTSTDWVELGLPHQLNIRIGIHAGPVYVNFDPIIRQISFTGAHVSRAARIEPITHEGEVFASEEFAALAAADQSKGFSCDLVGTTALAKSYGLFRVYSLERTSV
jgi:class 3 adenylate cyclase/tetratricopeptide (TPR) repeat protein